MNSRFFYILTIFLVSDCKGIEPPDYPNVLIILTDDQGYGDVSYNGNDILSTPNIDNLASQSLILDRFYVSPVCAPTRASLLTGRYHLSTGVKWVTHREEVMNEDEMTIAEFLNRYGYRNGLFGKWHNGKQYPHNPIGQGFDKFIGFSEGHINNYFNPTLIHNHDVQSYVGYLPDIITNEAIEFIRANDRFFTFVSFNTPHSPFQVPDKYFGKYKSKGLGNRLSSIYGMLENIDNNVGKLIKALKETGKFDDTLILFISDNGPNGERYNASLKGIKSHVDEGGVRVPALIRYPGKYWTGGKKNSTMVAHIDVLPTIIALVDSEFNPQKSLDGIDITQLLNGKFSDRSIFTHQVVRKFHRFPGAVRKKNLLLVLKDDNHELFDLSSDPFQTKNLMDSHPSLTDSLIAEYDDWLSKSLDEGGETELIQTGYSEIHNIEFPAPEAYSYSHTKFKGGEGWANDYFTDLNDSSLIQWKTKSVKNQSYKVILEANATEKTKISVSIDSIEFETLLDSSFFKIPIECPDRVPRGEVYEYQWPQIELGEFQLSKGVHDIKLQFQNPIDLEIKSLRLTKNP